MFRPLVYTIAFFLILCATAVNAQCPTNIGFDMGDFTGWTGYTGNIENPSGVITFTGQGIVDGIHSIITRASQQVDQYGGFSLTSPNGSSTIAKLGDNSSGVNKAQKLTYTFTVPQNNNDFSLIYYYAVVLEDPNDGRHTDLNKPKFIAAVYNVTDDKYTDCANFNFVSIRNLPGFTHSSVGGYHGDLDVYYKEWSPVTIDLRGYAGKTLRLEFTTNNCAPGAHFAYAYLDVEQNCASPVTGNYICDGSTSLTLKAPAGFASYAWYLGSSATGTPVATTNTYSINPLPAVGTQYTVRIEPYPGLGCEDVITTTIMRADKLVLTVQPQLSACRDVPVDITAASITAGSTYPPPYLYYTDAQLQNFVVDPTKITTAGRFYIKATGPSGCSDVSPITITRLATPTLIITNPPQVCAGTTVDISLPAVTAGSVMANYLTYFIDAACLIPLTNYKAIAKTNTYYIKATNTTNGCYDVKQVTVLVNDLPVLKTNTISACNLGDITVDAATTGSTPGAQFSYWNNPDGTNPMLTPKAIPVGTNQKYYIRATNPTTGCVSDVKPIFINVYEYPQIKNLTDPPAVTFPATIDITQSFTRQAGTAYYYYMDSLATRLIPDATKIAVRGTYYIQAVNGNNCSIIKAVHANINAPNAVDYGINTFTPNGDGKNDVFRLNITNSIKLNHFRIYGSWGGLLFETTDYLKGWDGTYNGQKMPIGTYYWILDGYDTYLKQSFTKAGSVTLIL
ncbi:gliding motility-associated-like protein [Mucilaginibacter gracilis]|uniref:Gliding motility-associated-like protein n=1 Tax=Mucilaginibacter gracilis TaxID=423350 RepID=A0A495J8T0_9SPHI|nr:gliding motility-associated C-terminal domain-containing protein [Mucilaginibacter gracilis]RKR84878.1 gliding motility-associated-like protein [Mucilaginibacter gracilis]